MWIIVGTTPCSTLNEGKPLLGSYCMAEGRLRFEDGPLLPVERGTEALAASAWYMCRHLGVEAPKLLLATDTGTGHGSRVIYAFLESKLKSLAPQGLTFHYLFPDVDWHNKVLMAVEDLPLRPILVADAGFMYVAKMSGYADSYDLFTPDAGEMAFLADEKAPHPFYTRGFLLESPDNVQVLLARAKSHGNVAKNLIIKGEVDYIALPDHELKTVSEPSVAAMEAIGGTGDVVTGLVTGLLCAGFSMSKACLAAVKISRQLAADAKPTPATQVGQLLTHLDKTLAGMEHVLLG